MKKTTLLVILFTASLLAGSQETLHWTIKHNKKVLLNSAQEDPVKNIIQFRITEINNKASFVISCFSTRDTENRSSWIRTIGIYTTADRELYRKKSRSVTISGLQLKKMLRENKNVKIYTWAIPKDPVQAARVRIRRVHLCTVELI